MLGSSHPNPHGDDTQEVAPAVTPSGRAEDAAAPEPKEAQSWRSTSSDAAWMSPIVSVVI